MPSKHTDLEENGTMPAESHCQAANGDHNALLTIHQSFATRSPLCKDHHPPLEMLPLEFQQFNLISWQ